MERRKPYLIPTQVPEELSLDPSQARLDDIRNLLSLCVASDCLGFRVEYSNYDGQRCGISPVDFIEARFDNTLREELLEGKSRELLWAEKIIITILNPKQKEEHST